MRGIWVLTIQGPPLLAIVNTKQPLAQEHCEFQSTKGMLHTPYESMASRDKINT